MSVALSSPLGFVELDQVWVDDRRLCTWALCDATIVAEPGRTVALVAGPGQGAPDAVLDLVGGWRVPVRGRVGIDGVDLRDLDRVDHLRALTQELAADRGERRLVVAGRTSLVAHPSSATLAAADVVVAFDAGFEVARGTHRHLLAASPGHRRLVATSPVTAA